MMNIEAIGENLNRMMKARGMSITELASRAFTCQSTVQGHVKYGVKSIDYLVRYADALGCTISDLTEGVTNIEDFTLEQDVTGRYPYNLAYAVFLPSWERKSEEQIYEAKQKVYRVYIPALIEAMNDLTDREQKVLELRYKHYLTLEQCGYHFNVTRERIRQVEAKALRKLRSPYRSKHWILDTMDKAREAQEKLSQLELENIRLKNYIESHLTNSKIPWDNERKEDSVSDISIDNLELSVRSFNCLKRAGIDTLGDLSEYTLEKLLKVRNLGRKSMEEVITKAKEYGIEIKSENENIT